MYYLCSENKGADQLAHPCSLLTTALIRCSLIVYQAALCVEWSEIRNSHDKSFREYLRTRRHLIRSRPV